MNTKFAFDLDGTVTKQELLPLIAGELGLLSEMRLLTRLTLDGTLNFEESFRLRCAILQSIPISRVQEIVAEVELNEEIAEFIASRTGDCFIVTGNLDLWIQPILGRLKCNAFTSTATMAGDRLLRVNEVLHKSKPVHKIKTNASLVVAIGDGANDVPMFEAADIGIAYGGVHSPAPALLEISDYLIYDGNSLCRLLNTL